MFGLGIRKKPEPQGVFVTARLNARIQPLDRGDFFEDPLEVMLEKAELGTVTGGGTQLAEEPAGIEFCDLEIKIDHVTDVNISQLIEMLNSLGAPKGSRLFVEGMDTEISFGVFEGMALYLNGVDLPDDTYANCDVNHVIAECEQKIGKGSFRGHWQGARETGLYFYAESYADMIQSVKAFTDHYPLCAKSRLEQIA